MEFSLCAVITVVIDEGFGGVGRTCFIHTFLHALITVHLATLAVQRDDIALLENSSCPVANFFIRTAHLDKLDPLIASGRRPHPLVLLHYALHQSPRTLVVPCARSRIDKQWQISATR